MEAFEKLLTEIGIENAGEYMQKPDSINVEELAQKVRIAMRAQLTNDVDFTNSYIEQGKQAVLAEYYDKTAQEFGLSKDEILNKPIGDTLSIAKNKAQAGISKQSKEYEDAITNLNKQLHEERNVIKPKELQALQAQITLTENKYLVKEALWGFQLADGVGSTVAENHIISEIFHSKKFKLTRDDNGTVLITTADGKAVRRDDKSGQPALDLKGVVGYLLETGGLLKKQGQQQKEQPRTGNNGFVPTPPVGNSTPTPPVSQEVIANAQRLAERYGQRR